MPNFVILTCLRCKKRLRIANDISRCACANCGTEYIVRRGGGVVSLTPTATGIDRALIGLGARPPVVIQRRNQVIRTEPWGLPNSMISPKKPNQVLSRPKGCSEPLVLIALVILAIWLILA